MSIDFKANRIRGYAIIASGTLPDSPAFLIYGSGSATDFAGTVSGNLLSNVGSDTFLFVSGAIGQKNTKYSKSTTVLGGDVVISGTLYNGVGTAYSTSGAGIGGADKNVQYNNAGSLAGSNNLNFDGTNLILTGSSLIKGSLYPSGTVGITGSLVIKDDTADTAQLTLSSSAGNTIFNMYNDGTFYLTNNKSSGQIIFGVTQPDTSQSQVLKIYPKNSQQSLSVFNETLAGSTAASPSASADTNFFVNGLVASKGTSNRGTAVFGGDLVVSGTIYNAAGSSYSVGAGGGGGGGNWNELSPSPRLNTTASVAIAGALGTSYAAQSAGSDVFFFVSGTKGSIGTSTGGTTVLGGDAKISGSLHIGNYGESGRSLTLSGTFGQIVEEIAGAFYVKDGSALGGADENLFAIDNDAKAIGFYTSPTKHFEVASYSPTSMVLFLSGSGASGSPDPKNFADTSFYVSGSISSRGTSNRGTAVFGGDTVISGSAYLGTSNTDILVVNSLLASDIIPDGNRTRNLGSDTARFANVYTGDLHLRNERGDYTLIEEEDCLTIRFNKNGKRYKFLLERAPEYDE